MHWMMKSTSPMMGNPALNAHGQRAVGALVMTVVMFVRVTKLCDEPHQAHFHKPVHENAAHARMHVCLHDAHVTRKRSPSPLQGISQTLRHAIAPRASCIGCSTKWRHCGRLMNGC